MKRPARLWRMVVVAGLLASTLAAISAPAIAQQDSPSSPAMDTLFSNTAREFRAGNNALYYPWVAKGDDFGLGPAETSISIQNLEDRDGQIWIYRGNGDGSWSQIQTAYLAAYASKTFTATMLGFSSGQGAPVAVLGWNISATPATTALVETSVILSKPSLVAGSSTQVVVCVVNEHIAEGVNVPSPFMSNHEFFWPDPDTVGGQENSTFYNLGDMVPWTDQNELQGILNYVNRFNPEAMINPFGGLNRDGDCNDQTGVLGPGGQFFDSLALGGVAKMAVVGSTLPYTSSGDRAVSGYNALNGAEVSRFDEWYLPIAQTNCGPGGCWDSVIRVANLSELNSSVEVRFFATDVGSGSLQTGFQVQHMLSGGETWSIKLSDLVPQGWVGSVHIYTDGYAFAMVDRFKVGYSMWITNTGSAANFENSTQVPGDATKRYSLFAPHVLMGYFGWNTGINVANLVNQDNDISIQFFNMVGNATQVHVRRLAPHGMTYFYDPAHDVPNTGDPNRGVVGSAIIWSEHPVAAVIDATKYPETNPGGGHDLFQATSYSATQNLYTFQAVPLVQKGNPSTGQGASSGINMLNPHPHAVTANVYWVNESGFNAANFGISSVTIPAFANGFVYSLWQHNLPNGFYGAAQVISNYAISAVSANVDYQVNGDGSAIFNAFNPCGYYRTSAPPEDGNQACYLGDPFNYGGQWIEKCFIDEDGEAIAGVQFHVIGTNPDFAYQRQATSGSNGCARLENLPVGGYQLNVHTVPNQYLLPSNPADTFTLIQGGSWQATNLILWASRFELLACLPTPVNPFDTEEPRQCSNVNLRNFFVRVYQVNGYDNDVPLLGAIVFDELIGRGGTTGAPLPVGEYMVCFYTGGRNVETTNFEEPVETYMVENLPNNVANAENLICGTIERYFTFVLGPGDQLKLQVPIFVIGIGTALDIQVHNTGTPVQGVQICIRREYWYNGSKGVYHLETDQERLCQTSDARGHVIFDDIQNHDAREYDTGITLLEFDSRGLLQPVRNYNGKMWVMIENSNQWRIACATGGQYTAQPNSNYTPTGCGGFPLENGDIQFFVHYVPTWDLYQDQIGKDIHKASGVLIGTYDLRIQVQAVNN